MQLTDYWQLYSLTGFSYCDCLLANAERGAWRLQVGQRPFKAAHPLTEACRAVAERARKTLAWVMPLNVLLDIGLDHLTHARAALYFWQFSTASARAATTCKRRRTSCAVRRTEPPAPRAPHPQSVPRRDRRLDGAREGLDEAYEIAERGPMRLHLADILPIAPGCSASWRADLPPIRGPRRATISMRRTSSSTNAIMAAPRGARRRRGGVRAPLWGRRLASAGHSPPRGQRAT